MNVFVFILNKFIADKHILCSKSLILIKIILLFESKSLLWMSSNFWINFLKLLGIISQIKHKLNSNEKLIININIESVRDLYKWRDSEQRDYIIIIELKTIVINK